MIRRITDQLSQHYDPGEARALAVITARHITGLTTAELLIHRPTAEQWSRAETIVERLLNDEPIQYIIGETRFAGLTLACSPAALIPRPETEEMVEMIVSRYAGLAPRILDLGTGTGAIALALAASIPEARVTATDISAPALALARQNSLRLKLDKRVEFILDDMLHSEARFEAQDVIVSNPPYIMPRESRTMEANVLAHEPHLALFASEADPVLFYRAIARRAQRTLNPSGRVYVEINPLLSSETEQCFTRAGFTCVLRHRDLYNRLRHLVFERK